MSDATASALAVPCGLRAVQVALLAGPVLAMPSPAAAECLGSGCYDGLGALILGGLAALVVVSGLLIWGVVVLVRRLRRH